MRPRRSLPQLSSRAPNAPAAQAYNARRGGALSAQDFADRGARQQAYAPPRNQVAELPGMLLEPTGLPSIRRSAAAFASGDPGTGALEAVQGGIGVLGLAAGMRGARAAPRVVEPPAQPFPDFGAQPQWVDAYRGLKQPFRSERVGNVEWWADNPDTAWTYARSNNGGNIIPGRIDTSRFLEVDADGNSYLAVPVDRIQDAGLRAQASLDGKYSTAETNRIARVARENGYDGVVFRNIRDDSEGAGAPGTVFAVLNNERRQSRFGPMVGGGAPRVAEPPAARPLPPQGGQALDLERLKAEGWDTSREPPTRLPVNPSSEIAANGLPIRPSEPFRNSLRGGSQDLREAARKQDGHTPLYDEFRNQTNMFIGPRVGAGLGGLSLVGQAIQSKDRRENGAKTNRRAPAKSVALSYRS